MLPWPLEAPASPLEGGDRGPGATNRASDGNCFGCEGSPSLVQGRRIGRWRWRYSGCLPRRGAKATDDRLFPEALHYFTGITSPGVRCRSHWNTVWRRFHRLPVGSVRGLFRHPRGFERRGAPGSDVRFDRDARACIGGRRKKGRRGRALGRSRFSTKITWSASRRRYTGEGRASNRPSGSSNASSASPCAATKTATNFSSFVALAAALISVKSVHRT